MWSDATLLKVTLLHGCFSRFLNCTNGTKLRKTSHMIIIVMLLNATGIRWKFNLNYCFYIDISYSRLLHPNK